MKWRDGDVLTCSFCGKTQKQVLKLIAGPGVYICDECIALCVEIIAEEMRDEGGEEVAVAARQVHDDLARLRERVLEGRGTT